MAHEVQIKFSAHLKRFVELPNEFAATGETVHDVLERLEIAHPGVSSYVLHENGKLRQHVNIFPR